MPSKSAHWKSRLPFSDSVATELWMTPMMDMAIGSSIIVVDVLVTHMLRTALAIMKPPFQRCIANATMNPPRNK